MHKLNLIRTIKEHIIDIIVPKLSYFTTNGNLNQQTFSFYGKTNQNVFLSVSNKGNEISHYDCIKT